MTTEFPFPPDPEEARLAALLRAVDRDAAPVDAERLAALEGVAADAFLAAPEMPPAIESTIPGNSSAATVVEAPSLLTNSPARRLNMLTLLYRGAVAVAASVVALVLWLNPFVSDVRGAVPFAQVMENLRTAHTLQFRLIQSTAGSPTEADVWFRAPGLVRREESPQRYQIAAGSRWWQIDETENSVTVGDSPWFHSPQTPVDLLALMDVGITDSAALLSAQAVGRESYAGRDCHVYRVDIPAEADPVEIEALADARTHQLVLIRAVHPAKRQAVAMAPLAQLELVAVNVNVSDDKFAVSKTLSEDGRIGKVSAAQGVVVLRPMLAKRWTPVCRETVLKPGDWLRTEHRGPNAIKATLTSSVELTLGPGSLLECISPTQARLHNGQLQVSFPLSDATDKQGRFTLLAPRQGDRVFHPGDKQLLRADRDEKLVNVPAVPVWLSGFEGTSSNESLGSLIVNLPDGRNEPLTVGYHKVSVEIRDQIARTTIEESFVNHTAARLEGVFHFPLPQDASISGFGMWIGNDLIEADVVEKQRAREIYETILREKRDPGLLEWTSGNLFKARVFPIEPRSEKRVKIVYTQVLPLRAQRYRYTYGLRSDLLQTKPLRELSLSVTVNSALPLKSISCPSHAVRTQQTEHAAQVEFTAQEYTPTRDFEVVCELDRTQADVVAIPHRRGDDGYLLVQLSPPGGQGNWQREVLPDGQPLHIVLLCDTSASMDSEKRQHQAEFVTTVLSSLGPDDRFQLAACDVGTVWGFGESTVANEAHIAAARQFLDERLSLGWTNLDRAFADVIQKAPRDAHVIYVGDGIISTGDTDASNFVKRVNMLFGTDRAGDARLRTFHAVGVGNTTDLVALRGIANSGGGSVRIIAGEQSPSVVALELLNEIAQPGLRDLKVEFKGVKIAAVYPDRLPNLPAGMQQILVARYLPQGTDQQGEIIVTGHRGSETVRFVAKVEFKDAEDGNSFIPRLWARSHLDHLLAQGSSPAIQDEIIGLSEEFHIITPYTSLLVLETDADRERFGVKRRYEMRDGERFFAEGRDAAQFDLLQAQMKRAGDWRQGLRRQALHSLANWGRDAQAFREGLDLLDRREKHRNVMASSSPSQYYRQSGEDAAPWSISSGAFGRRSVMNGPMGGGFGGGGYANGYAEGLGINDDFGALEVFDVDEERGEALQKSLKELDHPFPGGETDFDDLDRKQSADKAALWDLSERTITGARGSMASGKPMDSRLFAGLPLSHPPYDMAKRKGAIAFEPHRRSLAGRLDAGRKSDRETPHEEYRFSWLTTVFPHLLPAPAKATVPPEERWSAAAVALSESLLRTAALQQRQGGIELRRVTESHDPRWQRSTGTSRDLVLVSPRDWLTRPLNPGADVVVNYCRDAERGVYSSLLQLGSRRAAVDADRTSPPLSLNDYSDTPLHQAYHHYSARIEPAGDNRAWLILQYPNVPTVEHFLIDTARHVLLRREQRNGGKRGLTVTLDDFVEIDGRWWARKIMTTDEQDRRLSETTLTVEALSVEQFQQRMTTELAGLPQVQLLSQPMMKLKQARQDVADGRAGFDAHMQMALHFASLQQWDDMGKQIAAIEALAADKPGVRWLRILTNASIRRHEEARQALLAEARQLVAQPQPFDLPLATFVLNQMYPISAWPEFYQVVELIKPVYDRQPAELDARSTWLDFQLQCLDALQRKTEALALAKIRSTAQPWHLHWQTDYASRLMAAGQPEAAYAWLQQELDRKVERPLYEEETLRTAIVEQYRAQARWTDLLQFTSDWIARDPETQAYYTPYAIHLSALVYAGQLDAAYALAEQWLKEAQREGPLPAPVRSRLDAALNFASGSAYQLSFYRMPPRWYGPLADTARYFLNHREELDIVQRAAGHHQFAESDFADELRGEWFRKLQTGAATLSPAKVQHLVGWSLSGRMQVTEPIAGRTQLLAQEVPDALWTEIVAVLLPRWQAVEKPDERHVLSETLRSIYTARFRSTHLLSFLRNRLATADKDHRQGYCSALFDELLATAWTPEIEAESFALLHDMTDATDPYDRLETHLSLLYRWVDAMVANRQTAALKVFQDAGGQHELTRKELAARKAEIRTAALRGLATKLAELLPQEAEPLAAWVRMERLWLLGQLNEDFAETEAACWAILGEVPPKPMAVSDDDEADDEARPASDEEDREALRLALQQLLQRRALTTVTFLATRRSAAPASIERLWKYIEAGIAHGGEIAAAWKQEKMRLLIALDRPDDLDRLLREWAINDGSTAPWRIMLAHLAAERGQVAEAITLFEAAEKDKLLSFTDYRLLADWYLVMNRRADADRAKLEAMLQTPEHILANTVNQHRYRWMRSDIALPSELDEQTLLTYRALFRKSASPENYLYVLRDQYAACRDFRLLQMLPEAMLGRTPQQVYAFIQAVRNQLLYEVRNEATADEILAGIAKLRAGERTPTDLRALDLLEATVERKSAEVLNQPGPHVTACLAAMKRAFDREWQLDEPVAMANFLYQWGGLPQPALVEEQLRELRVLQKQASNDPRAHLLITNDLANLLGWSYSKKDEALQEMEAEVRTYAQLHDGRWPHQESHVLGSFISLYEGASQHAAGEKVLLQFRAKPEHQEQTEWIDQRLITLYNHALEHQGAVSLGSGDPLFANIVKRVLKEIENSADENVRYDRVNRLTSTFDIAHRRQVKGAHEALRTFAFETMPTILTRQQSTYRNTVTAPLSIIISALGPVDALRYAIERVEQYPPRLEIQWDDAWNAFGYELARQREAASNGGMDIAALEVRLFKLAVDRLQRDLRGNEGNSQYLYYRHYGHFWSAKVPDFARAAEAVLAERPNSGRRAILVANYLRHGLDLESRAIEVLHIANRNGVLDEAGQTQLANWLEAANRYAEMIPILEPFVKTRPDNINYRVQLMVAYQRTMRPQQMEELRLQTDKDFHAGGRWTEGNISALAYGCFRSNQFDHAVKYYDEAIALHQRTYDGSPMNDGTLSSYYSTLASAHSALGHTREAVEAATAAIVCWGPRHEQRTQQLHTLDAVIQQAKDLDAYVAHLDAETAKTGQDSPVVRKSVGKAYQSRSDHAKAVTQFQLALELQPFDKEVHQALIACYDALQQPDKAAKQLLKLIDFDRHDLTLFKQLADRYQQNEAEAERAATSIIEAAPNEAENHAAIAELRQTQDRWGEAIPHWQRMAELRKLEPTGLLRLAAAQIHQKQWPAAKETVTRLQRGDWPSRFNNVQNEVRQLQEQLPK